MKLSTLKRNSDFLLLRQKGRKVYPSPWLIIIWKKNDVNEFRWGCTLPKYIGPAVVRNRIKRWCREYFRNLLEQENDKNCVDINLVFKPKDFLFYKKLSHRDLNAVLSKGLTWWLDR
ncbi:MAG: ribonuclease P protein component [Bdellovibrionales bacterium]|nr:ribonuclease P protein component [Bdellovibrionales bacterium]